MITSADGTVLRPPGDVVEDGVRECAGDGAAPLPAPLRRPLALTRPSDGGFVAKLGPASDAAKGFAGDRRVPCTTHGGGFTMIRMFNPTGQTRSAAVQRASTYRW